MNDTTIGHAGERPPANSVSPASDLAVGIAAEHLVCADLLSNGFHAFRTEQVCPFDVAVTIGSRLLRVQVKGSRCARRFPQHDQRHITGYFFSVRHGKRGSRAYADDAFDLLALVALDTKQIAYVPRRDAKQSMQFPVFGSRSSRGKRFDAFTIGLAISRLAPQTGGAL